MSTESHTNRPVDEAYWLAHCEGYRVDCPDGRVGTVLEVSKDASEANAERLIVGSGLFRHRLVTVDPREVAEISPSRLRVRLYRPPLEQGPGPVAAVTGPRRRRAAIRSISASR